MSWTDATCTLQTIQKKLALFSKERNWEQYHNSRNLAMALTVEAGELLELFLWCRDDGPQPAIESRIPQVEEEVADVLICLLNLCLQMDIDLSASVARKIEKNALKYPVEKAYGRMEKHSELESD